jgi:hypothetical protein
MMPKGKKSCPKCNATHGPRKKVCDCGHVFIKDKKSVENAAAPTVKKDSENSSASEVGSTTPQTECPE